MSLGVQFNQMSLVHGDIGGLKTLLLRGNESDTTAL